MWKPLSVGLTGLLFLGGCAIGVKHDYEQKGLDIGITTPATVAVGTLDKRTYVVNGEKAPNFVGISRGGFGNPFDVTTRSGMPLAGDISRAIAGSLKNRGVNAQTVELRPALTPEQARAAVGAAGAQRSVLLTLLEWKSDMMVQVGLQYDLDLRVYDKDGKMLASRRQEGKENLGSGGFEPGGASLVLPRFRRMMELLFQEPDIVKALQP